MSRRSTKGVLCIACALFLALVPMAVPAQANRTLITEEAVKPDPKIPNPPPDGQIEGACGVAVSGGVIYVSDYYHHQVDLFPGSTISAGTPPEGPCGLALTSTGTLYANIWHESVVRLKPSLQTFDEANSTGVAVDSTGNVYVDDREYVAVYEPSGAHMMDIGTGGSLKDAYGVAVSSGKVYVPDAASKTVKVYEPAMSLTTPVGSIAPPGGFNSLVDAAVTVDPTNGHVLVVDNLQPGFEHPKAAIDEFGSTGSFINQLKKTVVDGGPSGIAVDAASGKLYVTSGNTELSNVFAFGAYTESGPEAVEEAMPEPPAPQVAGTGEGAPAVSAATVAAPATASVTVRRTHRRKHRRHRHQRASKKPPQRSGASARR